MCLGWDGQLNQMKMLISYIFKTAGIKIFSLGFPRFLGVPLFHYFEGKDFIHFWSPTHNLWVASY